jgi:hypothetical protein
MRLANCVRDSRLKAGEVDPTNLSALSAHAPDVLAVLRTRGFPVPSGPARTLVPWVVIAHYMERVFRVLAKRPHSLTRASINVGMLGCEIVEKWFEASSTMLPAPRDQDTWSENCGAAQSAMHQFLHADPRSLRLVRECQHCGQFFAQKSIRAAKFCRGKRFF